MIKKYENFNETYLFCSFFREHTKEVVTPASTKLPFKPRVKSTSALQSHHQPSIVQSNGAQKSKLIQCELTPQSILPSNPEVKSYKNKALDIRYEYTHPPLRTHKRLGTALNYTRQ